MKKSYFIIPLSLLFHVGAINIVFYLFIPETYRNGYSILYYNFTWFIVTYGINFYQIARRDGFRKNMRNFFLLFILYGMLYFTSFSFLGADFYRPVYLGMVYLIICSLIILFWLSFYWARKIYRSREFSAVRVAVIGRDKNLLKLRRFFDAPESGYQYMGYFDNFRSGNPTYLGNIDTCFGYIFENNIQEVYCMVSRLSKDEIQQLMHIADNGLKRVKIVPDNKEIFSRAMSLELYGPVPVLNLRASPLELEYANIVKRVFDIIFSGLVILLLLSWLTPLICILMRCDSKGSVFFKQKRHGFNRKSFTCYKFRSMADSKDSDTVMATKHDRRVTRLGRFLRKTSIDELPQFFNVLRGDMSVVGPRPHMEMHTQQYEKTVDKYLVRHFLKPGITGLAQIKGYRGEIIESSDIVNRVRYDIFYMEKWSLQLDLYIIFYTVVNAVKGQCKAY